MENKSFLKLLFSLFYIYNRGDIMIIDGHSHVGKDYYFGGNTLEEYDEFCVKNKIDIGLLMPMPWPVYEQDKDEVCSLIWEPNGKEFNYCRVSCKSEDN